MQLMSEKANAPGATAAYADMDQNMQGAQETAKKDKLKNARGQYGRKFANYRDLMEDGGENMFPLPKAPEHAVYGAKYTTVPEIDVDSGAKFPNVGIYGAERF